MKTIGIKLADGSFYPVLNEGASNEVILNLTTAHNNQTKVMVDLYRSKTNSMDDAEYVDSLQIDNLKAHPNGEPNISFTVSLDDNNNLSAKIVDSETGAQSNSTITLVSRTVEERLVTDEYNIEESKAVAAMATGIGLLAAAEAIRNKSTEEVESEINEPEIEVEEEFPMDDMPEETAVDIPDESPAEESFDIPDESFEMPEESPAEESFDLPDESTSEESFGLPDESTDQQLENPTVASQFVEDDLSAFGGEASNDEQKDSLENFFETVTEENNPTESEINIEKNEGTEDTSLPPDFFNIEDDVELPPTDQTVDFNLDDMDNEDFNLDNETNSNTSDDFTPSSNGISFTGLYDKETELGESEKINNNTKTPVIICIICAVICIIAVVLLLFVLPTKFNILNKKSTKNTPAVETTVEEPKPIVVPEPQNEPEPEPIPEAKEDEIIIIEKAEEVVPLPPPVSEEKPKDITYKIKWGDTLWDIADTYYKNPWRYKYLARFNGIKDPDYIISGTYITIPAE